VLLQEPDDQTQGFSFSELARQGGNPLQGADVILHLPQQWPVTQFVTYRGRWLRCVHIAPEAMRPSYSRSPRIVGLSVRALGGTVAASQSERVEGETVGVSNGKPGQSFQLQNMPVLARRDEERLEVLNPDGSREFWTEVADFSASKAEDRHYTLDDATGTIQFGPLIREPMHLRMQTQTRLQVQPAARSRADVTPVLDPETPRSERQYGAVPPRGATLRMVAYRTGGGQRGNVQARTIKTLKTAVPYVSQLVNHAPARHGSDAESLEQAVLRVPQMLRTRNRAVTPEDFEVLTRQAIPGAIARARCLEADADYPGLVRLLVVPQPLAAELTDQGLHPSELQVDAALEREVLAFLRDRKLLGVQIDLQAPTYIGVNVQTEVMLEPEYQQPELREQTLRQLRLALCRFLHPVVGGPDGTGWPFGRPVYTSDVVQVLQNLPGVRYLGILQLYEIRQLGDRWQRLPEPRPMIDPGPRGLFCSWAEQGRTSHTVILR
jgi:predicted phage baseplate assembly protein